MSKSISRRNFSQKRVDNRNARFDNDPYNIIKKPIITEKTMLDLENKVYYFEVSKESNKTTIKQAVEKLFGVEVKDVKIINQKPRPRRVGRYSGYKKGFKKARVSLTLQSNDIEAINFGE